MKFCQSIPQSRWRGRTLMLLALLLVLLLSGNKRTHNDETDDSDAPS